MPTILWTPDNPGVELPTDTAHGEQPVISSAVPGFEIPEREDVSILATPMPDEKDFRDYILVFPENAFPPIYVYFSKPSMGGQGSPKDVKNKIRKGQGPNDITRIDAPESSVPGSQWHAHGKNGGAINLDGTIHDGDPEFSKKTLLWLKANGWHAGD